MEKLKVSISRTPALRESRPASVTVPGPTLGVPLPRILNRLTDLEIPLAAWSSWHAFGKARELRRPLSTVERKAVSERHAELAAVLAPYHSSEVDAITVAIAETLGSYRSMRQTGSDALAMVESLLRSLAPYPAWAIVNACSDIKENGVFRDGKFDRRWAPNDADIVDAVRREINLYADQRRNAAALLEATVEA